MKLFDLHCDTPLRYYLGGGSLRSGELHITKDKLKDVTEYRQLAAFCVPERMSDEDGFACFFRTADAFRRGAEEIGFTVGATGDPLTANFTLTVEDARILGGDAGRLDALLRAGVGLVTPLWGGSTCIGGAHDTDEGLTPFGKDVVTALASRGVPVDVSHASRKSTAQIAAILSSYGMPVTATHSNAYSVFPHTRNLTDGELDIIRESGGIVGVSLYPRHLAADAESVTSEDVVRHIMYYLEKLGEDKVALGCDFDGIGIAPRDIGDVSKLGVLRGALLSRGVREETVDGVFFGNARSYFEKIRKMRGCEK
ncbi:MAG: membrane dipeptidase [Clostridia bacterium]|nr:membrane dipeptidase [Clostridia bacterium]